ncbi:O-antigen ligase family protein [Planomonospora corallina]|uniref:O-antigen ligase family protein n=1 Tax=Planomonospora corallina TaxID=1806052 RepID=A0ABV8I3P4_9ACTN
MTATPRTTSPTASHMTSPTPPGGPSGGRRAPLRRADGATLACFFLVALILIPARQVLRGLPISLTVHDILGVGILLCWLLAHFSTRLGVAKGPNPVRRSIFVFATVLLFSYGYTSFRYLPNDELNSSDHMLIVMVGYIGIALGVCDGVRGRERLDLVLKTVAVSGAVISFIGALQFLFVFDLTEFMRVPLLRPTTEEELERVIERGSLLRVASTTGHPIEFGVVSAMILPLAVHYAHRAQAAGRGAVRWWVCAGLVASGLMWSVSRSAVLAALAVGAVLFLGWSNRRRIRMLVAAVVALALTKVLVPGLLGTFYELFANVGRDDSISYRTHDYDNAVVEISRHPWLGRGIGTWYAPKHQIFDNQYILTAVESGLIGVATFFGLFVVAQYALVRVRLLASGDEQTRDLALALSAALITPLVGSATFDLLSFPMVSGLSFALLGAAGALLRAVRERGGVPADAAARGGMAVPPAREAPTGAAPSAGATA